VVVEAKLRSKCSAKANFFPHGSHHKVRRRGPAAAGRFRRQTTWRWGFSALAWGLGATTSAWIFFNGKFNDKIRIISLPEQFLFSCIR